MGNDDKHHVLERKPSNNNIEIGDSEITTNFISNFYDFRCKTRRSSGRFGGDNLTWRFEGRHEVHRKPPEMKRLARSTLNTNKSDPGCSRSFVQLSKHKFRHKNVCKKPHKAEFMNFYAFVNLNFMRDFVVRKNYVATILWVRSKWFSCLNLCGRREAEKLWGNWEESLRKFREEGIKEKKKSWRL
jgi:hypothetical protein